MGNCFSTTSDFSLNKFFQWIEEKGAYNHNLDKNLVDCCEVLKSEVFDVIADQTAQTSEVQKRPLQRIIVGQETMLETAWNHLMEDEVGTLGMYGLGGVGKTTLLKQINNKFSNDKRGFDYVIWVVVSKELHEIAEKAGIGGVEWSQKDTVQKSVDLYNLLIKKRFVLFLDDIWEKVELDEIWENGAFYLFQKKVGQTTLESDPGISHLAQLVAKKCCDHVMQKENTRMAT